MSGFTPPGLAGFAGGLAASLGSQSMLGDHLAQGAGGWEPQRQYNFLVQVGLIGEATKKIQLGVEATSLPAVTVEEIPLDFLNVRRFVAGKVTYEPIPLVIKDMVDIGTASAMREWHRLVYNPTTDQVGLAAVYKQTVYLILVAPNGTFKRVWALYGCWPTAVNFSANGLDMTANDYVRIEATLRYDKADSIF